MNLASIYENKSCMPHSALKEGDKIIITHSLIDRNESIKVGDIATITSTYNQDCNWTNCHRRDSCLTGCKIIHACITRNNYHMSLCLHEVSLVTDKGYVPLVK